MAKAIPPKPLSVVEKFYIEGHTHKTAKEIARTLDVKVVYVNRYLKLLERRKKSEEEAEKKRIEQERLVTIQEAAKPRVDDLMIKNKRKGVVVMTESASELGDATRQKMSARLQKNVQKIRPERS